MKFQRFIALGDSFTEGMTDEIVAGNFRGWADRVADVLTTQTTDFTYVNLAIRGKLVKQVAEAQVPQALPFIIGKETLVSFHAGANDVLRPNYRPENVFPIYNEAVRTLAATGATLMLLLCSSALVTPGKPPICGLKDLVLSIKMFEQWLLNLAQ